ncbi:MAG TPA: hypothetical protein VG099_27605 [Gemmataceae bacterium]|jgi:hypothetical protein|nr:hypothetical protein [Gemmataceae bacterium]
MAYPPPRPSQEIPARPAPQGTHRSEELFLVHAPGIDREELIRQIRLNAATRSLLPHPAAAIGRARVLAQRQALLASLHDLKRSMRDYGLVDSHRKGLLGWLDLRVKRGLRKLFQRHLLQERRVHLKLLKSLGRIIDYLETEDQVLRLCLDRCQQEDEQASRRRGALPEAGEETSSTAKRAIQAATQELPTY